MYSSVISTSHTTYQSSINGYFKTTLKKTSFVLSVPFTTLPEIMIIILKPQRRNSKIVSKNCQHAL